MMRALAVVAAALLASCATLVAPGPDLVPVSTTPQGATVIVDGAPVGKTPMLLPITRRAKPWVIVRLEADGLPPREVGIERVFNGWFVGNILFGGIAGCVIDIATANTRKVRAAERIDEDLTKPSTRPAPPAAVKPISYYEGYGDVGGQ